MPHMENPAALGARAGLGLSVCEATIDSSKNKPFFRKTQAPHRARSRQREIDFGAINRAAVTALRPILDRLLPGGKIIAGEYVALNPTRADRRLGSFKVRVSGSRAGRWCDFASGDKGGDPVSLVAYIEGVSQVEAARRLAQMLGLAISGGLR